MTLILRFDVPFVISPRKIKLVYHELNEDNITLRIKPETQPHTYTIYEICYFEKIISFNPSWSDPFCVGIDTSENYFLRERDPETFCFLRCRYLIRWALRNETFLNIWRQAFNQTLWSLEYQLSLWGQFASSITNLLIILGSQPDCTRNNNANYYCSNQLYIE